jgi:hypothetical protein
MLLSAKYICPVRGLADLDPPQPQALGQASRVAETLGLDRLLVPVLEESLTGTMRERIRFLDGLVAGLDRVAESKISVSLMVPAQEVLGLCWAIPDILKGRGHADCFPVYVRGKVRDLSPFHWWSDPLLIQKRVRTFREVVGALSHHPALAEWVVFDRTLDWTIPDPQEAEFMLKSLLGEIKEKGTNEKTCLSLGWSQLTNPAPAKPLIGLVDRVLLGGSRWPVVSDSHDVTLAAYLGVMAGWIFHRNMEVEAGWEVREKGFDPESLLQKSERLAEQGLEGVNWVSLCDPQPAVQAAPPWGEKSGLSQVGLLNSSLEPKPWVEEWIGQLRRTQPKQGREDFIDLSLEEYLIDPPMHLTRLWNHFKVLD